MEDTCTATRRLNVLARILQPSADYHVKVKPISCAAASTVSTSGQNIIIEPSPRDLKTPYKLLYTSQALQFVAELVTEFDSLVEKLHWNRGNRKSFYQQSSNVSTLKISQERIQETWKVAPVPVRLQNRHVDLGDVSPANTEHFIKSLLADVQGIQVDFDDGHCPTWRNQITGLHNVYRAVHGKIPGVPSVRSLPVLMLRPRAWNMIEHNVMVNGKKVPGPLFDFGMLMFHNAKKLIEAGSGPFFYLSKLEGAGEAQLWNDIFLWSQYKLGIPRGTIKACVLIENVLSSFEMDDILYELREHSLGLNCGIWDYSASIICKFGHDKNFVLPDRNVYVDMERHFLKRYMQLMIQTCHHRGAHATGGMAAVLLKQKEDESQETIIAKVCTSKLREIKQGIDGFMIYDLTLVPHVNKLWKEFAPGMNQMSVMLNDVDVIPEDLLCMPLGGVTINGLKHNIIVSILFIFHWFQGHGHFFYKGAVEDSATAEISRSQIWQWIRHQVPIEGTDARVTKDFVNQVVSDFLTNCKKGSYKFCERQVHKHQMRVAASVFMDIATSREFVDFITTYLNDSFIFWSYHKNSII